jgi:hypothetical protein
MKFTPSDGVAVSNFSAQSDGLSPLQTFSQMINSWRTTSTVLITPISRIKESSLTLKLSQLLCAIPTRSIRLEEAKIRWLIPWQNKG